MKLFLLLSLAVVVAVFSGCHASATSSKGFRLPDGDAVRGKVAFVALKCHTCHILAGESDLPKPSETFRTPVHLGGEVSRVKTYGELVTAVIHPTSQLSSQLDKKEMGTATLSPMGSYNHVMTVEQMVDLVAFLQPHYKAVRFPNPPNAVLR
jgi:sulfur-oxidizing protein SoxX